MGDLMVCEHFENNKWKQAIYNREQTKLAERRHSQKIPDSSCKDFSIPPVE
jgi:hypothetical protein